MKKFLAVLTMLLCILTTTALAADDPDSEGIKAFREALTSDSDTKERIFRQNILFASPFVQGELDVLGMIDGDTFRTTGDFNVWIYDDKGSVTEKSIPFYTVQNGKEMTVYFKADKKWEQFTAPTLAADVTDLIATPTEAEIEEIINDTKEVTILKENDYRRIMLVRLDGNHIADSVKAKIEANPDAGKQMGALQNMISSYMDSALRNADVWYMWTIDKRDWHTVAMQYNFSGVIQEFARAVLDDPNQQLSDDISNILETVAYYSEVRAYTTYPADPEVKKKFDIPKKVLKAKSSKV